MHKKIAKHFTLFITIVIIIGFFLRLVNLPDLFHFTYDEEVFAFVGKRMFVNGHIPLIGGVTPLHVHVAPYFYWLSGILLFLSNLNPIGWGIAAAFIAVITMVFLYKSGRTVFSSATGVIALFLYAFSFYQNIFDRHYWGLVFDGLVSLITFFSLFKILNYKFKYTFLLTAGLIFGLHADLSVLNLYVFSLLVFLIYRPKIPRKYILLSLLIFILSLTPLIVFDLRHNFSNSRGIFQYIQELQVGKEKIMQQNVGDVLLFIPRTLIRNIYLFGDTDLAKQYSYCPRHAKDRLQAVPDVLALILLMSILIFLFKSQNKLSSFHLGVKLAFLLFISTYLGISLYGIVFKGDLYDHYLATLFPIWYLLIAYVLLSVFKKRWVIIFAIIALFIIANLYNLLTAEHRFGYKNKINAVKWAIMETGNEEISLDVIGECFKYNGYRYLFYLFGKEPVKSYVDANFTHLFDILPASYHPATLVVITNPDFNETSQYTNEYNSYKEKTIKSQKFGAIEVLIVDNRNLDFVGKY